MTDWDGFLARVRKKAVAYTDELPNFICTQTVRRYATLSTDDRRILDEIVAEVSFFEKKERHRIVSVGNKPQPEGTEEVSLGMTSIGEFGTSLALLFDPYVRASFKFAGISSLRGRKTVCIRFEVSERTSRNVISIGTESVTVAYRGQCWVEPNSYQLMRLHSVAVRIPGTFPITQSESVTDYDMVDIAGRQYWLPVTSTVRMVAQNDEHRKAHDLYRSIMGVPSPSNYFPARMEARNLITYSKYCKFESKVKITY
ncbi:MAG TPA: hypothetical protein VE398_06065 [Acidobacteriota bacterium]|nr:hypothetical protein [Acidobacteriota bacterium]